MIWAFPGPPPCRRFQANNRNVVLNTGRLGSLWYYCKVAEILPDRLPSMGGADRLGRAFRATVDEMLELVGREQAELDWHEALVIEARIWS
jgi:hypothetical protein